MRRIQSSQQEDSELPQLIEYMEHQSLPEDLVTSKKRATQALKGYYLIDGILYM